MFNRLIHVTSLVLSLLIVLQAAAFADTIEGRVSQANAQAVDVIVYDAQGRPYPHALHLDVDGNTHLWGLSSAAALEPNTPISAEVSRRESGAWHADSISLFEEMNPQPATQKTSPSLRDALGSPVVRGALLGAATGAIASSTSGGKAGKGALVGAGVGAAAGLLGGLFSGRSKDSSDSDNR